MVTSCLLVLMLAVLAYLIFSLLDVGRTEPTLGGAGRESDYGYFRIKEWP